VTYNFDVDAWYRNQCEALRVKHERGELDADAYATLLADLDRRLDEMLTRLDWSFRIPEQD